jgi:hypothetical protein
MSSTTTKQTDDEDDQDHTPVDITEQWEDDYQVSDNKDGGGSLVSKLNHCDDSKCGNQSGVGGIYVSVTHY